MKQRLSKIIKELNISLPTAVECLHSLNIEVENNLNARIDEDAVMALRDMLGYNQGEAEAMSFNGINVMPIYNLLTYGSEEQLMQISEDDVTNLLTGVSNIVIRTVRGDNLTDAIRKLIEAIPVDIAFKKAVIVLRCSDTYSLSVSKLSEISSFINQYLPVADVRWGLACMAGQNANISLICAMTY